MKIILFFDRELGAVIGTTFFFFSDNFFFPEYFWTFLFVLNSNSILDQSGPS